MPDPRDAQPDAVSLRDAFRVWWRIGWLGFGGPAGQIALMHRELVERRRWISETRFLHALNYCMLLPGPEAQQLATYIGWLMHGVRGGLIAGGLFVLPGVIVLGVLVALYVAYGQVPLAASLFFGLKAAVLAVVVEAVVRIGKRALKSRAHVAIAALAFVAIHALHVPFPWLVLGAAVAGVLVARWQPSKKSAANEPTVQEDDYLVDRLIARGEDAHLHSTPRRIACVAAIVLVAWLLPVALVAAWLGTDHVIAREGVFFSQAAVVTFGGAYAVLAYVAQKVVQEFAWLQPGEMLDGLALAETTPGPLIMVLQFVGFVAAHRFPGGLDPWVAGVIGALLTTWVTFVPSFGFIFLGAPYVERIRKQQALQAALAGITAAVVGVILSLSAWFAAKTLFARTHAIAWGPVRLDVPEWSSVSPLGVAIAVVAVLALWRFKVGLGWVMLFAAVVGMASMRAG